MSLNKVMLIGHLGQDPQVKYLEGNRIVAGFTLATNEVYLDKNGERKTETEWHIIEFWDALAKNIDTLKQKKLLLKGAMVYIEGKIRTENYRDKSGIEVSRKKIKANTFSLLGSAKPSTELSGEMPSENAAE